jgi:hypothetical protein
MGAGTYKSKSAGWAALAISPEVEAACVAVATKGLSIAGQLAATITVTGEYEDSFDVRTEITQLSTGFGSHPVVSAILENTSGHAAAVEWGNVDDHRAHHILLKTLLTLETAF